METYYLPHSFRCLTLEEIGEIQHLAIDRAWRVPRLARKYLVSQATIYRVIKAVPSRVRVRGARRNGRD